MSVYEQSKQEPHRPFNATEKNCFARFINRNDSEVTTLILETALTLGRQGEHDQDDTALLDWDQARDLLTVAEELWRFRLNQGWHDDADRDEPQH